MIGIKDHGPKLYREGWVRVYQQHRERVPSTKLSDAMEQFIRYCESEQIKIPNIFFTAKRAIEAAEDRQALIPADGSEAKGKFDELPVY